MKALEILNKIYTDDGYQLCVELPITYNDVYEAISELEALQSRSCEGCKHLYLSQYNEYVDYCNDLNIEIAHNNISTFCCNSYEAKEQ